MSKATLNEYTTTQRMIDDYHQIRGAILRSSVYIRSVDYRESWSICNANHTANINTFDKANKLISKW